MQLLLQGFRFAANACGTKTGFLPSLYDGIQCSGGTDINIQSLSDIWIIVGNVIRILMALAGGLAVIMIIVGGIWYITATGDPARLKRAREIITQAVTGLVVVSVAYGVVTFIANGF